MHSLKTNEILFNKVPEVTFLFWVVKVMTTTVGETAADFMSFNLGLGLQITSLVIAILLSLFLYIQATHQKYSPVVYWGTIALISVFGTLVTDNLTDGLHIPLIYSSVTFTVMLAATFYCWYRNEGTLSIRTVYSGKRECYYWLAIFTTFALGTAVGDLVSEQLSWGYTYAGVVFGGLIVLIALINQTFRSSTVLCFWLAYILTRPLGASLGDLLIQPQSAGGLGINNLIINLLFACAILVAVGYFTLQEKKQAEVSHE